MEEDRNFKLILVLPKSKYLGGTYQESYSFQNPFRQYHIKLLSTGSSQV